MPVNLRYNKKISKYLLNTKITPTINLSTINWNLDNGNIKAYATSYTGLFTSLIFYLQKCDDGGYRLIFLNKNNLLHSLVIDDIEEFLSVVGFVELEDVEDKEELYKILNKLKTYPPTGVIICENGKIKVYEHK